MIIVLLFISAIALFITMTLIDTLKIRIPLAAIFVITLIASLTLIVKNDRQHFGMKCQNTTTTQKVYSVSPNKSLSMLLYKNIGTNGHDKFYIYNKKESQKKPSHTATDNTTNKVVWTNANTATMKQTETRWVYKNGTFKFWFGIASNNNELKQRENTFYVPKNWLVISTNQAQKLKAMMAKQDPNKLKQDAQKYVQEHVASDVKTQMSKEMKQNPNMNPANRKKLMDKLTKDAVQKYQKEYQNQMVQNIKEQL